MLMSRPSRRKTKAIQASQTTRERKNAAAKGRPIYFLVVSTLALVFFVHFISGGGTRDFPTLLFPPLPESSSPQQNSQAATAAAALPTCTEDQIASIKAALSDHCKGLPFYQKCAYTRLTKCPNQTWLDAFHKERFHHGSEGTPLPSYIGISVGCNKGMDALNSLRVGSQNDRLDKEAWKKEFFSGKEVHAGVCGQEHEEQVRIEENSVEFEKGAKHQMYCIEAMPSTADTLAQTAKTLGYDELGMTVINAAGGIQDGVAWFPNLEKSGVENQGMATCGANSPEFRRKYCTEVAVISLDSLATKYIGGFENDLAESVNGYPIIQTLNIDVEGYDMDVMLGGRLKVLPRVEYLEFEYNWMGSWANQKLSDAIDLLDGAGFNCYWAGVDKLWRITGCIIEDLYATHHWSNVACANRNLAPGLAASMEEIFVRTLSV